jgi:hypothetical protein
MMINGGTPLCGLTTTTVKPWPGRGRNAAAFSLRLRPRRIYKKPEPKNN